MDSKKVIEKLFKIAVNQQKILTKLAQDNMSAQGFDIEQALKEGNVWELSNFVAPLLDQAKIPETSKVETFIKVMPGPKVIITANIDGKTSETDPAAKILSNLLTKKFDKILTAAIQKNLKKEIASEGQIIKWINF